MISSTIRAGVQSNGATPRTPAIPVGMAAGEVMVCFAVAEASIAGSFTTPAGWTQIGPAGGTQNGTTVMVTAWWRAWQSGDAAPSIAWTGGQQGGAIIYGFSGVNTTTAVKSGALGVTGSLAGHTHAAIGTPATRGAWLVHVACNATSGTAFTPDWRMVELLDAVAGAGSGGTAGQNSRIFIAYEPNMASVAGPQNGRSHTGAAAAWAGLTFWLMPAVASTFGLIQSAKAALAAAAPTVTLPQNGTAGSLVTCSPSTFIGGGLGTNAINAVSYNGGANGLSLAVRQQGASIDLSQWYYPNNQFTGSIVLTATRTSGASTSNALVAQEWEGVETVSPVDQVASNSVTTAAMTVTVPTMAAGRQLLVAVATDATVAGTWTADADWDFRGYFVGASGVNFPALAQAVEMDGGVGMTWDITSSATGEQDGVVTTFRAPSAAPPPFSRPHRFFRRVA